MAYKKTEYIFLKGKLKWVRAHQPDPMYNKYNAVLYPDAESLEIVRGLQAKGLKNVLKQDEDGWNVNFSRPSSKLIRGKVVAFAPPVLLQSDGVTPFDSRIGNGSDGTIKIEVYEHGTPGGGTAKAARLESIRIDNLVPYETDSFTESEEKQTRGLAEQPKQEW